MIGGFDAGAVVGSLKLDTTSFKKSVATVNKGQQTMAKSASGTSGAFKGLWKQMAVGLGVGAGVAMAIRSINAQFKDVIQKGREFEKTWANVTTMLTISEKETERMKWQLIKLSPILGDTTELGRGMYQVLSASIEPAKAIEFLAEAAKSAKAGVTETATAVDALTTVINAYGMAAEDVTTVSDIMFQTVKRGKLTYEGMAGALGTVVPIAAQVGVNFEELAAAMATMTRQGIDVNTTTMQLRQILVAILKPSTEAIKTSQKLGIEFSATGLKAKGLSGFLKEIQEKVGDDAEALAKLFPNVRSLAGVMALGGKAAAGFAKDLSLMGSAAGSTEEAFGKQIVTMDAWMTTLKTGMDKVKIAFYEGFVESFKSGMTTTEELETQIKKLMETTRALGNVIGSVAKVTMDLADAMSKLPAVWLTKKTLELREALMKKVGLIKEDIKVTAELGDTSTKAAEGMKKLEKSIHGSGVVAALEDLLVAGKKIEEMLKTGLGAALAWANMKVLEKTIMDVSTALQEEMGKALYELNAETVAFGISLSSNTIDALERLSAESGIAADVLKEKLIKQFMNLIKEAKKTKALEDALKRLEEFKEGAKDLGIALDAELNKKLEESMAYLTKFRGELSTKELEQLAKKMVELADKAGKKLSPEIRALAGDFTALAEAAGTLDVVAGGIAGVLKAARPTAQFIGGIFTPSIYEGIKSLKKAYDAAKKYGLVFETDVRKQLEDTIKTYKKFTDETWKGSQLTKQSQFDMVNTIIALHKKLGLVIPEEWKKLQKEFQLTGEDITVNWQSVADDISRYWQTGIADMIAGTESFSDFVRNSFNIIAAGAGSAIGDMVKNAIGETKKLAGPIGSIVGGIAASFISLIGGLFGKAKSEAQKLAEDLERRLDQINNYYGANLGKISETTAKKFNELNKQYGGIIAEAKMLNEILADTGITSDNLSEAIGRMLGVIHQWHSGLITTTEAQKSLGGSFDILLDNLDELGTEGVKQMVKLIQETRGYGLEVKQITEYVTGQLDRIPDSLSNLVDSVEGVGSSWDDLQKDSEKLKVSIGKIEHKSDSLRNKLIEQYNQLSRIPEGSKAYEKLSKEIEKTKKAIALTSKEQADLNDQIKDIEKSQEYIADHRDEVDRLGLIALHTFNSMVSSGASWMETVGKMGDPIIALRDKYKEFGMEADPALQKLFNIVGVTKEHEKLFTAIDANKTIIEALGNSGWLTQDALSALSTDANEFYQNLIGAGLSGDDALRAMGPTLQNLQDYADAYNLTLDAGTQSLIDQAKEIDAVEEAQEDNVETQERLFKELGLDIKKSMMEAADAIGVHIKDAFSSAFGNALSYASDTAGDIQGIFSTIQPNIDIGFNYKIPDFSNITGQGNVKFAGGFQHGGMIEAGPYRPTAFVMGEGSQRERATIEHIGRRSGEILEGKTIFNATLNIYPQKLDDYAIDRASDRLFHNWKRQMERRGI